MVDEELLSLVRSNRLFSSLDEETCRSFLAEFTRHKLEKGQVLFYQGDPSDSVYLVISGKLSASLTMQGGESRIVGHIDEGETVGELGAISNEPRSLTIKALVDSDLLKLPARQFVDMSHRYPAILFATLHPIITRSRSIIQLLSTERKNKYVVIVPAHQQISLEKLSERLIQQGSEFKNVVILSDYDSQFNDKNASLEKIQEIIRHIENDKKSVRRFIYVLSSFSTPLARYSFRHADALYIAAQSDAEVKIDQHILDQLQSRHRHLDAEPNLILLQPDDAPRPQNASAWLGLTDFKLYHHVRVDNKKDVARLLRYMRGKAVGLVLSGGGTRGWSHLGVIKALQECRIPIDMIGGTSVGAVIGSCYGLNQSLDEARELFHDIVVQAKGTMDWYGVTWPAISLFSGKNFTLALENAFKKILIEEMWLPYFCVSSNLATTTEVIHTTGVIWKKNRASAALPGVLPPMVLDQEMHLDGGLLNNLPVDIMRQYIGNKGRIVAVELNNYEPHQVPYSFPPILGFSKVFLSKLGIGTERLKFPPFTDTFLRGLFMGSVVKAKQNSLAANVFVSLTLTNYPLLVANPEQADELINIGYNETLRLIQKQKNTEPEDTQQQT